MGILAECPLCHKKQSNKNRICKCGEDLVKAKRSQRVKYWINYRMPGGKQRRESVDKMEGLKGWSIEDAKKANAKRTVQKAEHRVLDMLPDSNTTFQELTNWYLELSRVKKLASFDRICSIFGLFNNEFGTREVATVMPAELDEYLLKRKEAGLQNSTVDMEMSLIRTMIHRAFDNDKASGRVLKKFRRVKKYFRKGENARKRTVSIDEYQKLLKNTQDHFRDAIITAYNTGMRTGEIMKLRWSHVDLKARMFRLPKEITKTSRARSVPINHHVMSVLRTRMKPLESVGEDYNDFVFTYRNKPLRHKHGFKFPLRRACEKAGLPYGRKVENGMTFHDFRRSVKTNMLKAGIDKTYRDLIVGHALEGMDVHYISPSGEDLHEIMEIFTKFIDGQLNPQNVDKALTKTGTDNPNQLI